MIGSFILLVRILRIQVKFDFLWPVELIMIVQELFSVTVMLRIIVMVLHGALGEQHEAQPGGSTAQHVSGTAKAQLTAQYTAQPDECGTADGIVRLSEAQAMAQHMA